MPVRVRWSDTAEFRRIGRRNKMKVQDIHPLLKDRVAGRDQGKTRTSLTSFQGNSMTGP